MTKERWCKTHKQWEPLGEHCRPKSEVASFVHNDVEPHYSPAAGRVVTSRSEIRDACRRYGLVEVGNQKPDWMK